MKKLFGVLLGMLLFVQPLFAADQWGKATPAGTDNMSDIDTVIQVNNEALDRLVIGYRRGLGVNYSTADILSVLAGEVAIPNAAGTVVRWRRETASTNVPWSSIDTGGEASATQYYLYATADTDITGMVFKISASSSAPSGITYYRKIAEFYNDASGNITNIKSLRNDDGTDYHDTVKVSLNMNGTGTIAINDQMNVASITDNATGDWTATFSTAFANTYYSLVGTCGTSGVLENSGFVIITQNTTSARFSCQASGTGLDRNIVSFIATGDSA